MESISRCRQFCRSSIGRKYTVAITGFLLCGFVLMHMSGNLLILVSAESYNRYAHQITHNPLLLYPAEFVLSLVFLIHIFSALRLAFENRKARGLTPLAPQGPDKSSSFAARSMALTGLVVLVFLIWHLKSFRFGPFYEITYEGNLMRDLHRLVVEKFTKTEEIAIYLLALGALWTHLSHGVSALFQTVGLLSSGNRRLRKLALGFATVITLGFAAQPLYIYWVFGPFLKGTP